GNLPRAEKAKAGQGLLQLHGGRQASNEGAGRGDEGRIRRLEEDRLGEMMTQVFQIAPPTARGGSGTAMLVIVMILLVVVVGGAGATVYALFRGARHSTFELSPEGLHLRGDLYGRMIPANQLVASEARRVDVVEGPYRPVM